MIHLYMYSFFTADSSNNKTWPWNIMKSCSLLHLMYPVKNLMGSHSFSTHFLAQNNVSTTWSKQVVPILCRWSPCMVCSTGTCTMYFNLWCLCHNYRTSALRHSSDFSWQQKVFWYYEKRCVNYIVFWT